MAQAINFRPIGLNQAVTEYKAFCSKVDSKTVVGVVLFTARINNPWASEHVDVVVDYNTGTVSADNQSFCSNIQRMVKLNKQ